MIHNELKLNWRKVTSLSACFVFTLAVLTACKKDETKLSAGVLSPEELLASGGIDTFQLETYSELEDSFQTDNQTSVVLGAVNDPIFGISVASFYTQFNFEGDFTDAAGSVPVVDSVVLSLEYKGYFGNLDPQTFEVYELSEDMDIEEDYYKYSTIGIKPTNLVESSSATQTPNPTDDMVVDGDTVNAQLRLHLDKTWAEAILTEGIDNSTFDTEESFKTFFKGFRINVQDVNPSSGTGGLFYFDLTSNDSKLTFYYKTQDAPTESKTVDFIFDDNCADFTHAEVDNSGHGLANVIADHSYGATEFYAQSLNASAVVKFPTIINQLSSTTVIHDALLELPIAYQTGSTYYPSTIIVAYKTEDGENISVGNAVYDDTEKSYVLDLRDYVQDIVAGNVTNLGIKIISYNFSARPERIIFNGVATANKKKPRLIIKYTEF